MRELLLAGAIVIAYAGLLVGLAEWAERREARRRPLAANPLVYSLALGVYATTWTFYGSVGFAARHGLLFLTVYLGPTLCAAGWWWIVRKLVHLKKAHRVTSLPDVLALRYERSQSVALLATGGLVVGLVPYVALQLKTMIATLGMVAGGGPALTYPGSGRHLGAPLVAFLLLFTVAFGLRRVRPAERHPGMMVALAAESVVKLVAFLAAGVFVVWRLFHGPADVFRAAAVAPVHAPDLLGGHGVGTWLVHLFLSGVAVLLLPRQFHVAVIENSDEDHVRTAMWLFPAYLLLISVFALPVALGALALHGAPTLADTFVLSLPAAAGSSGLAWAVFLGGFSAGTGMVVVETTALATMLSNHAILPAAGAFGPLGGLRRHVRATRWAAAAAVLLAAFAFERAFGPENDLASIGLVSFAAVLQLAPALAAALLWPGASRTGALGGMAAGFATWGYTLVVPILARAGWLPATLVTEGPFGIRALVPEALFSVHTDPVTNAVIWTLVANAGALVVGSLLSPPRLAEVTRSEQLLRPVRRGDAGAAAAAPALAAVDDKRARALALLSAYHPPADAALHVEACLSSVGARPGAELTALDVAAFEARVERTLAASIGAAAAHAAVRRAGLVTPAEARAISGAYGEILAGLHLSPEELLRKIDYHRERERLLARDAADQQFLAGVSSLLASSLDLEATARNAVRLPVPHLAHAALLALREDGRPRIWFAHVDPRRERAGLDALERAPVREPASVAAALRTGRLATAGAAGPGWPDGLRAAVDAAHEVTLPLAGVGEPLGTLTLFAGPESRVASPEGLALAEELVRRLAIAVDNARLYASAEAAIRARDDFLAIASHELKTPLTPLRIQMQTLERIVRRGELDALPRERLWKLVGNADGQIVRLVRLIDKLLDLTRIRAKRFRLDVAPMDLAATARTIADQHGEEIAQAGGRLSVLASGPVLGTWDRVRVEQVLANLLSNAAKYAPGSPVEVRVDADAGRARLVVRDEGPGIAETDQERLFHPFERARQTSPNGLGLGLFIVRQIVEAHGGTIGLRSRAGKGTTFVVELPRAATAAVGAPLGDGSREDGAGHGRGVAHATVPPGGPPLHHPLGW